MGTLLGNEIWKPDNKAPIELHATTIVVGTSASNAIAGLGTGVRQRIRFTAANQTEKNGIEALQPGGLIFGDECYLADTNWLETFGPNGWTLTRTLSPVTYNPAWGGTTNITLGNGVNNFYYHVADGICSVEGYLLFGSTTVVGVATRTRFPMPLTPAYGGINIGTLGLCLAKSGVDGTFRHGIVVGYEGTTGVDNAEFVFKGDNTTGGLMQGTSPTYPFAWATRTNIPFLAVNFRYAIA